MDPWYLIGWVILSIVLITGLAITYLILSVIIGANKYRKKRKINSRKDTHPSRHLSLVEDD